MSHMIFLYRRLGFIVILLTLPIFGLPSRAFSGSPGVNGSEAVADLIGSRDFKSALTQLDSLLTLQDLSPEVRSRAVLQRAVCLKGLQREAEALPGFESSHAFFPEIEDYLWRWEGECLEALKRPEQASERYAALVKGAPSCPFRDDVRLRIARIAEEAGRRDEAVRLYEEISRTAIDAGDVAHALYGLASNQAALGQVAKAQESGRQLVHAHPSTGWALKALQLVGEARTPTDRYDRGQVYYHHGRWAEAANAFRSLAERHPSDSKAGMALYWSARSQFSAKEYAPALVDFTRAYRKYGIPSALFYIGRCAVRADDDRKGADHLLEFAAKHPDNENADEALWYAAWSLERLKDYSGARQAYLRLAEKYPKSRNVEQSKFRACFVLYSAGKLPETIKAFTALGDASQGYLRDQAYFWVGKCHEKLGDASSAATWYRKSAKSFPASYYAARAALNIPPEERETLARAAFQSRGDNAPKVDAPSALPPFPGARRGDLLAFLGLYAEAGRELSLLEKTQNGDLSALRGLLQRYERIRAYGRAVRVAGRIVELEQQAGKPFSADVLRRLYPTYYSDLIEKPAAENRVEHALVLAIIRQESAFDPTVVSSAGARGLMQIMPSTGEAWAADMGIRNFRIQLLDDPAISIRYGCREIATYLPQFPSDLRGLALSLSAYNAGLNAAQRWDKALSRDVDEFIENVPYHETRNYIKQVVRNYEVYKLLLLSKG